MRKFTKYPSSSESDYVRNQPRGKVCGKSFKHVFDVLCTSSYEEDEEEYWSEGCQYLCGTNDGESYYIETNFGGLGCISPYNLIEDLSEYFEIVSK